MTVYKIYCDESNIHEKGRYKLFGGIWIKKELGWEFVDNFLTKCEKEGLPNNIGHIKWTKTPSKPSDKHMFMYKTLVDLYFKYNEENPENMFFRSVVVDPSYDFKHEFYHKKDYEIGFYKVYYQLIFHTIEVQHEYHIRVASRPVDKKRKNLTEKERLVVLQEKLNNKLCPDSPARSIEARSARERILIQLADIFIGAIGFHWNSEHLKAKSKKGKLYLAKYIANKLKTNNLRFTTSKNNRRFNIFYLNPKK